MRKVKTIYIHWPPAERIWVDVIFKVIGPHHDLREYDASIPLSEQFADVEVLLDHGGRMATREIIDACPKLKLWQMITVGYDVVDFSIVDGRNIAVTHCPGATSAVGLAETAMMFMLMLVKRYRFSQTHVAEGRLGGVITDDLEDKVLAIIGFGASGRRLAHLASAFGMKLMIIEPLDIEEAVIKQYQPEFVGKPADLEGVLSKADFISLHLPLVPETTGLINEQRIAMMKPSAYFINVARNGLVDNEALNRAVMEGRIAGLGSDVFADETPGRDIPIFEYDNVVATSHFAGTSTGSIRRRIEVCLENLNRIGEGLEPKYRVR